MNKPVHKHDCECCIYLDTQEFEFIENSKSPVDLYFCEQMSIPTVIGRYGIDGDYMSGLGFIADKVKQINTNDSTINKLNYIIENSTDNLTITILAQATKIALEKEILNEDLSYNKPLNNKIKI